jgi:hypothetical protein
MERVTGIGGAFIRSTRPWESEPGYAGSVSKRSFACWAGTAVG